MSTKEIASEYRLTRWAQRKDRRSSFGDIELNIPRDRKGDYEPQLVKKHQTSLSGDIEAHIQDIYGLYVSDSTVSRVTGQDTTGGEGMAEVPAGERLRRCFHGRHPLSHPKRGGRL